MTASLGPATPAAESRSGGRMEQAANGEGGEAAGHGAKKKPVEVGVAQGGRRGHREWWTAGVGADFVCTRTGRDSREATGHYRGQKRPQWPRRRRPGTWPFRFSSLPNRFTLECPPPAGIAHEKQGSIHTQAAQRRDEEADKVLISGLCWPAKSASRP